MKTSFELVYAL